MALTRDFKQTVMARANRDRRFREALLVEAINEFLGGDLVTGKALLRDYINAVISFDTLAGRLGKSSKSLQRMLGPSGNPTAANIFAIIKALQEHESIELKVTKTRRAA